MATATKSREPLFGEALVAYITKRSKEIGLDPSVPLAIIPHEGGFYGAVGDKGSSFGPFQLHRGGALPSGLKGPQAARAYAQSPAGIDYALNGIKSAITKHGDSPGIWPHPGVPPSVYDAVAYFERPKNIDAEWQQVGHTYARIQKDRGSIRAMLTELGILGAGFGAVAGGSAVGAGAAIAGKGAAKIAGKTAGSAAGALGNKTGAALVLASLAALFPKYAVRVAEALAGAVLILLGLLTLMRAVTGSATAGVPVPRP